MLLSATSSSRSDEPVPSTALHLTFSLQRFSSATTQLDIESLSHITKALYSHNHSTDILTLHVNIPDLVSQALLFLELYDCETVGKYNQTNYSCSACLLFDSGDPQTAVGYLGNVVLFLQLVVAPYNVCDVFFCLLICRSWISSFGTTVS